MTDVRVTIVTATLNRQSLAACCRSVDSQSFRSWHHYVIGDGVLPQEHGNGQRSTLGFSAAIGAREPAMNMPGGTPNPLLRWAIQHLDLAEFLCFLDDDNEYLPEFLAAMVHALETNPNTGIVLCEVDNRRAKWRPIDGFPEYRRCDNSGFLVRSHVAKAVGFPPASPTKECMQDYEFIKAVADKYGWTKVGKSLVLFGTGDNPPPTSGGVRIVDSWSRPLKAVEYLKRGDLQKAILELKQCVASDTLDAWALWHLGEGNILLGDIASASDNLRSWCNLLDSVDAFPDDWTYYNYAFGQYFLGYNERGAAWLERAISAAKANDFDLKVLRIENLLNLGLYHLLAGRISEAKAYIAQGTASEPEAETLGSFAWKIRVLVAANILTEEGTIAARAYSDGHSDTLRLELSEEYDSCTQQPT